jgi:hypothetical protein
MKSDLMHSRVQLEKDILNRLVTEVHETVATDVKIGKAQQEEAEQAPKFGVLNLWSIRRNSRSARQAIKQPRIVTGLGY